MASSEKTLKLAARRAYERGRLISACSVLLFVVPASAAAAVLTFRPEHSLIAGALLAVVSVALMYRGEVYARAVGPGLAAGLVSATAAISMCHLGICGPAEGPLVCAALCFLGGAGAGAFVVRRSLRFDDRRRTFLLTAASVAFLTGALGCTMLGVFGVLGLAIGVGLAAIPVSLIVESRSR